MGLIRDYLEGRGRSYLHRRGTMIVALLGMNCGVGIFVDVKLAARKAIAEGV